MREVFYIGGSPCCGKSSMAAILARRHSLRRFNLDDHLDRYMYRLAKGGNELCKTSLEQEKTETWLRAPDILCEEEAAMYRAIFPLAQRDIAKLPGKGPILAEGAGFMPGLAHGAGVDAGHYVCVVPARDFQWKHYAGRSWIKQYLAGYEDQNLAFENWMERDALFAKLVLDEAHEHGYETMVVDGTREIEACAAVIEQRFGLAKPGTDNAAAGD